MTNLDAAKSVLVQLFCSTVPCNDRDLLSYPWPSWSLALPCLAAVVVPRAKAIGLSAVAGVSAPGDEAN